MHTKQREFNAETRGAQRRKGKELTQRTRRAQRGKSANTLQPQRAVFFPRQNPLAEQAVPLSFAPPPRRPALKNSQHPKLLEILWFEPLHST